MNGFGRKRLRPNRTTTPALAQRASVAQESSVGILGDAAEIRSRALPIALLLGLGDTNEDKLTVVLKFESSKKR
jgi:hypothetical protein